MRRVLLQCVICKKHNRPSFRLPIMPPWPHERVSRSEPFQYIGLTTWGPISVKEGDSIVEIWICLFTCLAVHAVHLEMVKGLSAEAFLDCVRRFVSRRGCPRACAHIYQAKHSSLWYKYNIWQHYITKNTETS